MSPKARCTWTLALALLQGLLGLNLLALALVTSLGAFGGPDRLPLRDTPYWAAVPVIVSSAVGVYYLLTQRDKYGGDITAFLVKCVYFVLSSVCAVLCAVAAIFPASHAAILLEMTGCRWADGLPSGRGPGVCLCVRPHTASSRHKDVPHMYEYQVSSCEVVRLHLPALLATLAAVAAMTSLVSLGAVLMLWRARYGNFYSGLRFYTYSADDTPSSPARGGATHAGAHNMYVLTPRSGDTRGSGGGPALGAPHGRPTNGLLQDETTATLDSPGPVQGGSFGGEPEPEEQQKLIGGEEPKEPGASTQALQPRRSLSSPEDDGTDDSDS